MNTYDDLIAAITEESTVEDGLIALAASDTGLIATLKQQVADLLSGTVVPPVVQAKIDEAFADAQANIKKVTDAVTANTPQA